MFLILFIPVEIKFEDKNDKSTLFRVTGVNSKNNIDGFLRRYPFFDSKRNAFILISTQTMTDVEFTQLSAKLNANNSSIILGQPIGLYLTLCRGESSAEERMNVISTVIILFLRTYDKIDEQYMKITKRVTRMIVNTVKTDFRNLCGAQNGVFAAFALLLIYLHLIFVNLQIARVQHQKMQNSKIDDKYQIYSVFVCVERMLELYREMLYDLKQQAMNCHNAVVDNLLQWFEQRLNNRSSYSLNVPGERDATTPVAVDSHILQVLKECFEHNYTDTMAKWNQLQELFANEIVDNVLKLRNGKSIECDHENNWYGNDYSYSDDDKEEESKGCFVSVLKTLANLNCFGDNGDRFGYNSSGSNSNSSMNNDNFFNMNGVGTGNYMINDANLAISSRTTTAYLNPLFKQILGIPNKVDSCAESVGFAFISADYAGNKPEIQNLVLHNDVFVTLVSMSLFCKIFYTNFDINTRKVTDNYEFTTLTVAEFWWMFDAFIVRAITEGYDSGFLYFTGHGKRGRFRCKDDEITFDELKERHARSGRNFKLKIFSDSCSGSNNNILPCLDNIGTSKGTNDYKLSPRHNLDIMGSQELGFSSKVIKEMGVSPATLGIGGNCLTVFGLLKCSGVEADKLFIQAAKQTAQTITKSLNITMHGPVRQHNSRNTQVIVSNKFFQNV